MTFRCPRRARAAAAVLVFALIAAACGGSDSTDDDSAASEEPASEDVTPEVATSEEEPEPEPTAPPEAEPTPEPAVLELIEPGPYEVGVTTIQIVDESRDRPLTVDVWFPLAQGTTGDPHQYTLLAGVYYESPVALSAAAASISPDGPFPLVVYSHGSGGIRYIHSSYTEAIASHGYIVMAPDHTGNTATERLTNTSDPVETIALNRPLDISVVIDAAVDPTHPTAGAFTPSIDVENIAVTGHSFGGYTSYAVASGVTIGDAEVPPDTRVDALIPLAPAASEALLSDEQLSAISVPTMIIVGTDDKTTPIDPNEDRPWELSPAEPQYRVELLAGEHQTFTDLCEYQDFMGELDSVPELILTTITEMGADGCSVGDMPIERAVKLTNTLVIDFLDAALKGEELFDPTAVELPEDITVEAK